MFLLIEMAFSACAGVVRTNVLVKTDTAMMGHTDSLLTGACTRVDTQLAPGRVRPREIYQQAHTCCHVSHLLRRSAGVGGGPTLPTQKSRARLLITRAVCLPARWHLTARARKTAISRLQTVRTWRVVKSLQLPPLEENG